MRQFWSSISTDVFLCNFLVIGSKNLSHVTPTDVFSFVISPDFTPVDVSGLGLTAEPAGATFSLSTAQVQHWNWSLLVQISDFDFNAPR